MTIGHDVDNVLITVIIIIIIIKFRFFPLSLHSTDFLLGQSKGPIDSSAEENCERIELVSH
jgi:hypothetical protein